MLWFTTTKKAMEKNAVFHNQLPRHDLWKNEKNRLGCDFQETKKAHPWAWCFVSPATLSPTHYRINPAK